MATRKKATTSDTTETTEKVVEKKEVKVDTPTPKAVKTNLKTARGTNVRSIC